MKRALATGLSLVALSLTAPCYAQPKKPADKTQPAPAQQQDLIQKAQQQFDDQQYEESIQTLTAALLRPNNTQAQKVDINRLLALNYITLGHPVEADAAVRALLVAQPDYQLPPGESPRFRDFFAKTREKWEAEGRPGIVKEKPQAKPVVLRHSAPERAEAGQSIELVAKLEDPDARAVNVKLHFRVGGSGDFEDAPADLDHDSVHAQIPGASVKPPTIDYYFEVLDGAGGVIATRGDAQSPLRIAVPEKSSGSGWTLPLAIGGGVLGAAAIVGVLALAGVFKSDSSPAPSRGTSNVSVSIGNAGLRF